MIRGFWLCGVIVLLHPICAVADWEKVQWKGETVWRSVNGEWSAIVSGGSGRLVALEREGRNLLYAPPKNSQNYRGGHIFWLGPQDLWKWPPPADWEAGASEVQAEGKLLKVRLPHTNTNWPVIEKWYRWEGDKLRCEARWTGTTKELYAMHLIAVPADTTMRLQLRKSPELPQGFGFVAESFETKFPVPPACISIEDEIALVKHCNRSLKYGFPQQPIAGKHSGGTVVMYPATSAGKQGSTPDYGCLSPIYLSGGVKDLEFIELEQYSIYLRPDEDGVASSVILLEPLVTGEK